MHVLLPSTWDTQKDDGGRYGRVFPELCIDNLSKYVKQAKTGYWALYMKLFPMVGAFTTAVSIVLIAVFHTSTLATRKVKS